MEYLIYRSSANVGKINLADILITSRINNRKFDVTGFLITHSKGFVQLIEGSEQAINQLYTNICSDQRHANITLLARGHYQHRRFPSWDMGYTYLAHDHVLMNNSVISQLNANALLDIFTTCVEQEVRLLSKHGHA